MKFNWFFVVSALAIVASYATSDSEDDFQKGDLGTVNSSSSGFTLKVWFNKTFQSNRDVEINYSVINKSDSSCKIIHADAIHDIKMNLTDPHGHRVIGYHEMKGSTIDRGQFKRFFVKTIEPNQEGRGDTIPVSLYWPIKSVGEYKCVITKTIYRSNETDQSQISILRPGIAFEIVSPEFKFQIKSIDETFKSPAEAMVRSESRAEIIQSNADNSVGNGFNPSVLNISLIAFVLVLIGYLIFSLWRRRHS